MAKYLNLKPIEFDKLSAKRKAAVKWEGRILLPKYDGCLALVYWQGGNLHSIRSRDDKPVRSMDHIEEDLIVRYPWLSGESSICILGEAWNPGVEFAVLSGTFRRQRPQPSLGFAPFDIVDVDKDGALYSTSCYEHRLKYLQDYRHVNCLVYPPNPVVCEGQDHAERYARNLKALGGYDGAIASDPDAAYVVSDGMGEFLKVKPIQTFSLRVAGVDVGVGDKTGRATIALRVAFKGGTCGVGTGFSEADAAAWAADPALVVGRIAEVGCMAVYPGDDGMMREPRFLGWRDDVINPDF